ncbi:TlyA family RNA methyltransferase [Bacillaceae bacterium SIJ1]|uniref:TlyA family RNA methyltransferase n=1 Tax=Litoribacterium kuwaitense TaxID=1398745 RepID=UPI0013EDC6B0|nr:TlyA family RNA methyltransferase [Litoribacterium kuwaitense]NGP43614.1 TlyA family RNA methyltransferase [Litoribacterium kuwaitense]
MNEKKERVDILLVQQQLIETREQAKRAIMAGLVYSGTERIDKPGQKLLLSSPLRIKGKEHPYVGRGGLKLEKALQAFSVSLTNKIMVDIGASTGGFTDCALQNGARLVYAVDVGTNQLAWSLRSDHRVVVMEKTNFRYATEDQFDRGLPEVATIDVSFISLSLIFPALKDILAPGGDVIALIKPQFEAGKERVGKKGIVRDPAVHHDVLLSTIDMCSQLGFVCRDLTYSPITGGDGNIEYLAWFQFQAGQDVTITSRHIEQVIQNAHLTLAAHA